MLVTEFGIVTERKPEAAKALAPMLVTEFGIATVSNNGQPEKALAPMFVTELPIVNEDNP